MHPSRVSPRESFPVISIALIAALTLLCSGWTCSAMFVSCQGVGSQPQIVLLSPNSIPHDADSVPLTVEGNGFNPQSQIMWNGNPLQTTLIDRHQLQTTITPQVFESLGGSPGSSVEISVSSKGASSDSGCPIDGNSDPQTLAIH